MNPLGLVFVAGQAGSSDAPMVRVAPLAQKSMADLKTALNAAGAAPGDVLRVTCFCSSLEDYAAVRAVVEPDYRRAALNFVQIQRAPFRSVVECEAVAKSTRRIAARLQFENPPGLTVSPNFSHLALVSAPRLVLSGTQVSYGYQDSDARRPGHDLRERRRAPRGHLQRGRRRGGHLAGHRGHARAGWRHLHDHDLRDSGARPNSGAHPTGAPWSRSVPAW